MSFETLCLRVLAFITYCLCGLSQETYCALEELIKGSSLQHTVLEEGDVDKLMNLVVL